MSLSLPSLGSSATPLIGNAPGWLLSFFNAKDAAEAPYPDDDPVLEIGQGDYYADIQASLPSGLEGGVYSFVIEGLTDAHYGQIARKKGAPDFVKLYLYWLDTNQSVAGYLANLAGLSDALGPTSGKDIPDALVAVLKIVSVSRKAGERRYETTITAREWLFETVSSRTLADTVEKDDVEGALDALLQDAGKLRKETDYKFEGATPNPEAPPPPPAGNGTPPKIALARGASFLDLLKERGRKLELATGCYGRGMFLMRNGCLHLGTRPIPLKDKEAEDAPKKLTLGGGLVETLATGVVVLGEDAQPTQRRGFKLTLKGRPDLKPGHVVQFDAPPEDAEKTAGGGLLGAVGDLASDLVSGLIPSLGDDAFKNPVTLYVDSVEHRLGRTSGFVTTVTGLEIPDADPVWDVLPAAPPPSAAADAGHANPEIEAARAVRGLAHESVESRSFAEVAEVRAATVSGQDEPPSQTLTLWRGVVPGDPHAFQARRTAIERPSPAPAAGAPYATPFAWGKCGLVLPRYPGTRVVVVHRDGRADDPIDVGALWESGHGPDAQPGDWWLILPVGVPAGQRDHIGDDDTPQEHTGKVTQDLIDADGNRVIEVGELTIRVGRDDKLQDAGTRPQRGQTDAITIEHAAGNARIVIDQNGKVQIQATEIEFDAGSGNITLKANQVNVKVDQAMDVS